jgi:hypothetical protein
MTSLADAGPVRSAAARRWSGVMGFNYRWNCSIEARSGGSPGAPGGQ